MTTAQPTAADFTALKNAIETMSEGFALFDADDRLVTCNDRYRDMYGYSETDACPGVHISELLRIDLERNTAAQVGGEALIQRRLESFGKTEETFDLPLADGRWVQVRDRKTPDGGMVCVHADISAHMHTEAALHESEELFRSAFETSAAGMVLFDGDGNYIKVNQTSCDLLGYSQEELLTMNWRDVSDPDYLESADATDKKMISGALENFEADKVYIHKDGHTVWTRLFCTHLFNADGTLKSIFSQIYDISSHKAAEEALRDSREHYALAMRSSNEVIYDTNLETGQVRFSSGIRENFGLPELADSEEAWAGLIHPDHVEAYERANADLITGKTERLVNEYLIRDIHGDWRWVRQHGIVLRDDKGWAYRMVGATGDITERKQAETELAEKEALLRLVLDNMPGGIRYADKDKKVLLFNALYQKLWDFPDDFPKIGDTDYDELSYRWDRGDYGEGDKEKFIQALLDERPFETESQPYEVTNTAGRILECRSKPAGNGGYINIYTDVTERRRAVQLLHEAKEQAEAAARAKSEFVAVVSHEVRTPMNGVLGIARLLLETPLMPEQRDYAESVVESGEALMFILNDLLDISKLEAGKLDIEPISFAPGRMIADTVNVMASTAREKGLNLSCDIEAGLPKVLVGDVNRIRQIIFNLLSNAIKFTDRGSVIVTASGAAQQDDRRVFKLSVTDTGIGLDAAEQDKLFAPYTQANVDIARRYGGTGLGLSICRRLADLMGGEVTLESTKGKGSTFTLILALAVGNEADIAAPPARSTRRAAERADGRMFKPRALLVEDIAMNRKVALGILRKIEAQTVVAENGKEALELIDGKETFDVILMDRHMPVMDGIEATRQIRAMEGAVSHTPIIGLTAAATRHEIQTCLEAGMNDVVTKPIDPGELIDAVLRLADPDGGAEIHALISDQAPQPPSTPEGGGQPEDPHAKLLADVSHEMRGIMNRVLGYITTMEDAVDTAATVSLDDPAGGIAKEAQRLIGVADRLTTASEALIESEPS